MLKPITLSAVKLAALLDIEVNNETTTLGVKTILRQLGVEAVQSDVSYLLSTAADQLPLNCTSAGSYNTYTLPDPSAVASPSIAMDTSSSASKVSVNVPQRSALSYIKRDDTIVAGSDDPSTLKADDWIVSAVTLNDSKNIYFDGSYTRDDVRFAFSKLRNVNYVDTRASRN
jgi:hypothetical protein